MRPTGLTPQLPKISACRPRGDERDISTSSPRSPPIELRAFGSADRFAGRVSRDGGVVVAAAASAALRRDRLDDDVLSSIAAQYRGGRARLVAGGGLLVETRSRDRGQSSRSTPQRSPLEGGFLETRPSD